SLGQAWRWNLDSKPLWVIHCLKHDGGAGQSAVSTVYLLNERSTIESVVDLTKFVAPTTFEDTPSSDSAMEYGNILAEVYENRLLVLASRLYGTILVHDLHSDAALLSLQNVPAASGMKDIAMTVDEKHIVQINSDGQFFIHEVGLAKTILQGRQVDD